MEKMSTIVIAILLLSGVGVGMSSFFSGTAIHYANETTTITNYIDEYDQQSDMEVYLNDTLKSMSNFDPNNPLTWGNFVSTMINVVKVLLALPAHIQTIINYTVVEINIVPVWVVWFIQLIVMAVIIFAGLSALNKYKV